MLELPDFAVEGVIQFISGAIHQELHGFKRLIFSINGIIFNWLKPTDEFAYELQIPFKDLSLDDQHYISFSFDILDEENAGASLVYQVNRDNQLLVAPDDSEAWFGKELKVFNLNPGWNKAVHARKIDPYFMKDDVAKIFFWNPNRGDIYIRNFTIQIKQVPKKNK